VAVADADQLSATLPSPAVAVKLAGAAGATGQPGCTVTLSNVAVPRLELL
jgi:hypothetical protein